MARPRRQVIRQALGQARPVAHAGLGGRHPVAQQHRPGGPAAPPAPTAGGLGGPSTALDSGYFTDVAALERKRDEGLSNIGAERDFEERYFGLAPGYSDAKANPYSQAALLQRQQQQGQRAVLNGAGLQLYAGSTRNKQAGVTSRYAQSLADLKQRREQEMAKLAAAEQAARNELITGRERSEQEAIERAGEQEPEPMPAGPEGRGRKPKVRRRRHR